MLKISLMRNVRDMELPMLLLLYFMSPPLFYHFLFYL